jgi:hypothetical protein
VRPDADEAMLRIAAVATVTQAMAAGVWPIDTESLDALADLIAAASRWQLVAELEAA